MPFGAHETMEAHEILNEKLNLIQHFSFYLQHAGHPALRQLIERHIQTALQAYDQMRAYTHDYSAAEGRVNISTTAMPAEPHQIGYGLRQPAPVSPQMSGRFDDGKSPWRCFWRTKIRRATIFMPRWNAPIRTCGR